MDEAEMKGETNLSRRNAERIPQINGGRIVVLELLQIDAQPIAERLKYIQITTGYLSFSYQPLRPDS
jgi:hypothetical protein